MPFKFHLKKSSRQYNVVSKNQYVISIDVLNSSSIECTLSIDSSGQECLENVAQRVGLGQSEFFGLCYMPRQDPQSQRWVDLDKPLKRQLEKNAKNFNLYLRIMYYISDVQYIHDDITRYHYYLQLKSNILEGKICCNVRQAIMLASYSMQAELGNYNEERHQPECFQQFTFFPKSILQTEPGGKEALLNSAIGQYKMIVGMTQVAAEEYYMTMIMQLEGYGYETFSAKDEGNNDTILGISINGIMVAYPSTQLTHFYRWKDISNVINHKKTFRIECQTEAEYAKQFNLRESRIAKYVWRLCIAQHTFYMQHQQTQPPERTTNIFGENENIESNKPTPSLHLENNGGDDYVHWTSYNDLSNSPCPVVSVSTTDINNLRALLPSYRPAPDYETAIQMKYNNGNNSQPYYANGAELSCLLNNVVSNSNRF